MPVAAELALIERIRASSKTRNSSVINGIGDDCAVLRVPRGHELLVTTDFSLEGRHFRRDWHSPESVGHRCLARGLSDIAAMGGKPLAAFLSIALPPSFEKTWLDGFMAGFNELAARFDVELAGGDTAQAPGEQILADIVLTGSVPRGKALLRSGARVGDFLYVTGKLGGSAAELERIRGVGNQGGGGLTNPLDKHPHLFPEPRLDVGQALRRRGLATACMDLSDGLSSDLQVLATAANVGFEVQCGTFDDQSVATFEQALHGGEDYELLFTASPATRMPRQIAGVPISKIGRAIPPGEHTVLLIEPDRTRTPVEPGGWEHFS